MNEKHSLKTVLRDALLALLLIAADQGTKLLAVKKLMGQPAVSLIPGVLEFTYVENNGMAFGLLKNGRPVFIVTTIIMLGLLAFAYSRIPEEKKFRPLSVGIVLIIAGAIGNFIDRVRLAYVVDFISLSLIRFPVFNLADIFVTWTAVLLAVLLLFRYSEEDLKRLGL